MHPLRFVTAALLSTLTAWIAGCHAADTIRARPAESPPSTPTAVRGIVRLRPGTNFPPGATLRIVARWWDTKLGEQTIYPVGNWPVDFVLPLKWPEGKDNIYSSSLRIHATAELGGRALMVTDEIFADPPPQLNLIQSGGRGRGAPVELVLFPTIE